MNALLIQTEGFALAAEVEINGHRLIVMDQFSPPGGKRGAGVLQDVRLSADEFAPLTWEAVFSGNPNAEKRLTHVTGWTYLGYGQVVQVDPMIVDFGFLQLEVGPRTHDRRCVGEFVKIKIDRLSLSSSDNES